MCDSSLEQLFRVRFLYLFKDKSSVKKVRYLRVVPTRKSLIYSSVDNLDDDSNIKDVHISVETVPLRGGNSSEIFHLKLSELCEKLFRG